MHAAASNSPYRVADLSPRDVHVWLLRTSATPEQLEGLAALLSADEIERADRFQVRQPKDQFVVGRASLRLILGAYLDERAEALRFRYGAYGKPELEGAATLCFSVSHSGDVALIAVADGTPVGVDVEQMRTTVDHDDIARQYFCGAEVHRLSVLPEPQRRRAFFQYWTSKEATAKAIGGGLTIPLDAIEVEPTLAGRPANVRQRDSEGTRAWFAYELDVPGDYAATLVAPSSDLAVRMLERRAPEA